MQVGTNPRLENTAITWGGLFVTDPNRSTIGRVGELASRFTWQATPVSAKLSGRKV